MSQEAVGTLAERREPSGIGGWLILPVIGMFLTPLRALTLVSDYEGFVEAMPFLSPTQNAFVVIEILVNVGFMVVAPILLLVLLFKHRALFPRLFIVWGLANLAFLVLDLIAAPLLFGEALAQTGTPLFDAETAKEFGRSVVTNLIWVPYMALSRRVKNTFVT